MPKPHHPISDLFTTVAENIKSTPSPTLRFSSPHLHAHPAASSTFSGTPPPTVPEEDTVSTNSPSGGGSAPAIQVPNRSTVIQGSHHIEHIAEKHGAPFLGEILSVHESAGLHPQAMRAFYDPTGKLTVDGMGILRMPRAQSLEGLSSILSDAPVLIKLPRARALNELGDTFESIPKHSWMFPFILACAPNLVLEQLINLPKLIETQSNSKYDTAAFQKRHFAHGVSDSRLSVLDQLPHQQHQLSFQPAATSAFAELGKPLSVVVSMPIIKTPTVVFPSSWRKLGVWLITQDPSWRPWEQKSLYLFDNFLIEASLDGRTLLGYLPLTGAIVKKCPFADPLGRTRVRFGSASSSSATSSSTSTANTQQHITSHSLNSQPSLGSGPTSTSSGLGTMTWRREDGTPSYGIVVTVNSHSILSGTNPLQSGSGTTKSTHDTSTTNHSNASNNNSGSHTHTCWLTCRELQDLEILQNALMRASALTVEDVFDFPTDARPVPTEATTALNGTGSCQPPSLLGRGRFNEVRLGRRKKYHIVDRRLLLQQQQQVLSPSSSQNNLNYIHTPTTASALSSSAPLSSSWNTRPRTLSHGSVTYQFAQQQQQQQQRARSRSGEKPMFPNSIFGNSSGSIPFPLSPVQRELSHNLKTANAEEDDEDANTAPGLSIDDDDINHYKPNTQTIRGLSHNSHNYPMGSMDDGLFFGDLDEHGSSSLLPDSHLPVSPATSSAMLAYMSQANGTNNASNLVSSTFTPRKSRLPSVGEDDEVGNNGNNSTHPAHKTSPTYNPTHTAFAASTIEEAPIEYEDRISAVKLVSKEIFWERVESGKERGDALIREVLAQLYLEAYWYWHEVLMQESHSMPFVRLYSVFETPTGFALELELMEHNDLFDVLAQQGPLPECHTRHIMAQLLDAVAFAQKIGIAHRDIKLSNITFPKANVKPEQQDQDQDDQNPTAVPIASTETSLPQVKLADFGMAGFLGADRKLRGRCGTPGYVAPDILSAGVNEAYGINVDIFSLGVVAYTLLCGYEPFYGQDNADLLRANRVVEYAFHPPEWEEIASEAAKDWIARSLTAAPDQRWTPEEAKKHPWLRELFCTLNPPPPVPLVPPVAPVAPAPSSLNVPVILHTSSTGIPTSKSPVSPSGPAQSMLSAALSASTTNSSSSSSGSSSNKAPAVPTTSASAGVLQHFTSWSASTETAPAPTAPSVSTGAALSVLATPSPASVTASAPVASVSSTTTQLRLQISDPSTIASNHHTNTVQTTVNKSLLSHNQFNNHHNNSSSNLSPLLMSPVRSVYRHHHSPPPQSQSRSTVAEVSLYSGSSTTNTQATHNNKNQRTDACILC
jgi:calcium/calmodulin-dependent protein kinase I